MQPSNPLLLLPTCDPLIDFGTAFTRRSQEDDMRQQGAVSAVALLLAMAPTLAHASASAAPRMPVRIHAIVEKFDQHLVTVKTDKGDHLTLELTTQTGFATVDRRALTDIKLNAYVGVAAVPGTDRKLHATRVFIFPDVMRGAGEGHFPGRAGQGSVSINATVTAIAVTRDGTTATLHWKSRATGNEGWTNVDVAPNVPIVAFRPGDASVLKAGADTVTVVQKDGDGDLHALEIVAGQDIKPPM